MADKEIKFTLRFSTQSLPDQLIQCRESWSVKDLKKHLRETCESKPAVEKQRLIYSGHCLKDDQILRDVFKRRVIEGELEPVEDVLQVVHLVCAVKEDPVINKPEKPTTSVPSPAISNIPTVDPNVPTDINAAYAQAYYDYLSQYYSQSAQTPHLRHHFSVVARIQQNLANNPNNPRPNENINPRPEQPDFLDTIYKLVRVGILIILILYSPMERLLFVGGLICLMLYVQQRRERQNRAGGHENPQPPPQPEQPQEPPNNNQETPQNDNNNNQVQEDVTANPTAWSVFWSTVVSFFSSLIPENPVPLNVN